MNILIIGLGSIAKKHIAAINEIDGNAVIYALRSDKNATQEPGVVNIYSFEEIDFKIDFCIISNPTSEHYNTIKKALNLNVPLFIEKPSLMSLKKSDELLKKIRKKNILTYVAFNLRFNPVIEFLSDFLNNKRIIEVNIYCGSYLPDWRPDIDYTKNYSAIAELGGGVHLDLIHEIDYAIYLFGKPKNFFSFRKKISDLRINSMDIALYHLFYDDMVVNIVLNYYRILPKREIEIVIDADIITADLLAGKVIDKNGKVLFSKKIDKLYTYKKQMSYFYNLINGRKKNSMNNFENSLETLKICLNET